MIVIMLDQVLGYEIDSVIGLVCGNVVCVCFFGWDFIVGLCNFVGGEVFEYIKLLFESCEQVMDCMVCYVEELGVDVVIIFCLLIVIVMDGLVEIFVYGMVVKLK